MRYSHEKETAVTALESSTDSSNEDDRNKTDELDHEIKLFESGSEQHQIWFHPKL